MLSSKDESFEAFKKFRALVEKNSKNTIKVFRTDRGGEFSSKQFMTYCENEGITRHFTAPYSPQQNGVVERRNRTIVAMARSFLKEKQLPSNLWGEAARHFVYVLNRLPTRALSEKTPYEVWTGNKPNLSHIRVFGCITHMKQPSVHLGKLDDRSKVTIYLGRESGTKASRLYDPETRKITVSRDVIFEEHKSWDWNKHQHSVFTPQRSFTVLDTHFVDEASVADEATVAEPVTPGSGNSENTTGGGCSENSTRTPHTDTTPTNTSEREQREPKNFRLLSDIYDETHEVELEEELLLAGVDEPKSYGQAVT